jgi:ABC-2 type transport system permease protein
MRRESQEKGAIVMTHAFTAYALLTKWSLLSMRTTLPFIVLIQVVLAVGTVYGLGYLYPAIDPLSAQYIVTGATTMTLITIGMTLVPQNIARMKEHGVFDYLWSLPVPRLAILAAEFTVWTAVVAPGAVLSLVVGSVRYDFALSPSPLLLPAFLLISLTAVAVGMTIAHLSPSPVLTAVAVGMTIAHLSPSPVLTVLVSNVVIFGLFLFSPVNFPVERLPGFLAAIHAVLPVASMADLVRGTVTDGLVDDLLTPFAIVAAWCVASVAVLAKVFTRRA